MKWKRLIAKCTFLVSGFFLILSYQNCSKVTAQDMGQTVSSKASNADIAMVTDGQGSVLPLEINDSDPKAHNESNRPCVEQDQHDDLVKFCGFDSKSIENIIDVAQLKGQNVNFSLLKGKTIIFSSDDGVVLKSLDIDVAVGRTIICGVKVDRLNIKKGRLELYHSEINEMGEQHGDVVKDASSLVPNNCRVSK